MSWTFRSTLCASFVSLCLCGDVFSAPIQSLAVFPPDVSLATARGRQSVVVQATFAAGITRDVTADAKLTLTNPALAKLAGNVLTPAGDGSCELKIKYAGQTVSVPVTVKEAAAERPISFKRDVMPVFMRAGCNQGTCHGAA